LNVAPARTRATRWVRDGAPSRAGAPTDPDQNYVWASILLGGAPAAHRVAESHPPVLIIAPSSARRDVPSLKHFMRGKQLTKTGIFVYGVRMLLADVLGTVTAPEQVPSLRSHRLLVVRRVDQGGPTERASEVAVDLVGAGPGDRVLLATGSAARLAPESRVVATDLAIVAIVDSIDVTEGLTPRVSVTSRSAASAKSTRPAKTKSSSAKKASSTSSSAGGSKAGSRRR